MDKCTEAKNGKHLWKIVWQRPPGARVLSIVQCLLCEEYGYKDG